MRLQLQVGFSKQCVSLHIATEDVSFCVDRLGC